METSGVEPESDIVPLRVLRRRITVTSPKRAGHHEWRPAGLLRFYWQDSHWSRSIGSIGTWMPFTLSFSIDRRDYQTDLEDGISLADKELDAGRFRCELGRGVDGQCRRHDSIDLYAGVSSRDSEVVADVLADGARNLIRHYQVARVSESLVPKTVVQRHRRNRHSGRRR